jgi:arabinogalactan endo-1,4-beta-galactosidase
VDRRHFYSAHFPALPFALAFVLAVLAGETACAQTNVQTKAQDDKFFLGADISALDAPGGRPSPPYQEDGKPSDEVTILKAHGWTAFRVRVFVAPVRKAPNNTLENAIPLAKRIKASGAIFILDLHFSDTWADPQHQEIPVAWQGMDIKALAQQWQEHAQETVKAFKDAGAMPDIVQIGNEITRGAAWPLARLTGPRSSSAGATSVPTPPETQQWKNMTMLLKAGIRGVQKGAGHTQPRIAIHIDQGGHWETTEWYFDRLNAAHVHYDIIAQSFYPPWGHGTLDDLWNNMNQCALRYHKDFLVMETGYTPVRVANKSDMFWPVTPEGRLQFMVDLVNTVKKAPGGLGVMYWAPERDLWNEDGSPAPAVFTLDQLTRLAKSPDSHAPAAVNP